MIKIENVEVYGWEAAIRGMRNPKNSWSKSDSNWEFVEDTSLINPNDEVKWIIGKNDLELMQTLYKAGSDHRKFMRMINVTCDITAPLYWWKEFDTYKVGTVANSCSTMHKIQSKEFTLDDFSHEHLTAGSEIILHNTIVELNEYRNIYNNWDENDDSTIHYYGIKEKKDAWWQMIQLLPSSYNQRRTIQMTYEVMANFCRPGRREDHKLDEWRELCAFCHELPYFDAITKGDNNV